MAAVHADAITGLYLIPASVLRRAGIRPRINRANTHIGKCLFNRALRGLYIPPNDAPVAVVAIREPNILTLNFGDENRMAVVQVTDNITGFQIIHGSCASPFRPSLRIRSGIAGSNLLCITGTLGSPAKCAIVPVVVLSDSACSIGSLYIMIRAGGAGIALRVIRRRTCMVPILSCRIFLTQLIQCIRPCACQCDVIAAPAQSFFRVIMDALFIGTIVIRVFIATIIFKQYIVAVVCIGRQGRDDREHHGHGQDRRDPAFSHLDSSFPKIM